MSNPYVLAGYLTAAAVLVLYWVHLRHRGRVLARALGQPRPDGATGAAGHVGAVDQVEPGGPVERRP